MENTKTIAKARQGLHGTIEIPGDKSISHRSVMFSALGSTPVHITNFLHAQDCLSTAACMKALGASVEFESETALAVCGHGLHGLQEASTIIDAGNSGTTLRLMMGILAPQPFLTTFTGDASLYKRPMGRVIKPLSAMGAKIYGRENNTKLPITIVPAESRLHGMVYESPVASAQVKSLSCSPACTQMARRRLSSRLPRATTRSACSSLRHRDEERGHGRDDRAGRLLPCAGGHRSARRHQLGGLLARGGLRRAGQQPALEECRRQPDAHGHPRRPQGDGASVTLENERVSGGEAAADIRVEAVKLHGTSFGAEIMPRLIDEIPVIAVAALFAEGDTVITGAGELRVKETDRLQAITNEFNKLAPALSRRARMASSSTAARRCSAPTASRTTTTAWRCRWPSSARPARA